MGKPTGFLEYKRKDNSYRNKEKRLKDYKDVVNYLETNELQNQAARCMECGIPFCHVLGCPLSNLIPEWNDFVYKGQWKEAYERLSLTNNFPEITGRVCPATCESSCTLSINDSPVSIKNIELTIIEKAFKEGWVIPQMPVNKTGKKIAVIGSGPAGLAASQDLCRLGHDVTLFEKSEKVGGYLRYGIPDFKLEKNVIDRRVKQLKAEGVEIKTNINIGTNETAESLLKSFDAVLLTMGAGEPRDLPVPGREHKGVYFAMEYLSLSNKFVSGEIKEEELISAKGKNVLVIGGGDTGSDCVGTANRQGAKKVTQIEIMPKPMVWDKDSNPNWPDWPLILRTSSSHKEGCEREWNILTKSFEADSNGNVKKTKCIKVKWNKAKPGERPSFDEIKGTEFEIEADIVLLSMGFVHPIHSGLINDSKIELDNRGNVKTNEKYATSLEKVFAAGDVNTGASLVVRAINHGKKASLEIDEFLKNR